MTVKELRPTLHIGRAVETGGFERLRNGRTRRVTTYKHFIRLSDGREIEQELWVAEMKKAVEKEAITDLYLAIKERVSQLAWLHKEPDIEQYALECLAGQAYKHWKDFSYKGLKQEENHEN